MALCVLISAVVTLADRVPRQLDRYLQTRVGEAGLYRVTYADGSTGFLTANVVRPSADSLSYSAFLGEGGRAVQVNYRFTNWLGSGLPYTRVDTLARNDNRLLLLAQQLPDSVVFLEPPLEAWSAGVLQSSAEAPLEADVQLYGEPWTVRQWLDGDEPVTLPDGTAATAQRFIVEWWYRGDLTEQTTMWIVPGIGEVRLEQRDGQSQPIQTLELLTNTRLAAETAARLPFSELVAAGSASEALFRGGPRRTGAWPADALGGPDLQVTYRWQSGVSVTASPVYADGLFYLANQDGQLVAVDAYGGAPRWQFTAGGPIVAAPAVSGGIVYVGAGDKRVYALEAQNGHFLWQRQLRDNVSTSALVADGTVYVGAEDRALYALDARTGALRWRFVAGDRLVSSPALADGRLVFGADDGVVYVLEAATGRLLWRHAMDDAVEATPALSEAGLVFAASRGQQLAALDAATGEPVWVVETRFGFQASPALGPTRVYAAGVAGTVYAYDAATGAPAWEWSDPNEQGFVSSPILVGEHLIGINTDALVHVWDAATGALLHTLSVGDAMTASPAWMGDALLAANSAGDLLALQGGPQARGLSLTALWEHEYLGTDNDLQNATFYAEPLLLGETLYAVLRGGRLLAIEPATGASTELADFGDEVWASPAENDGTLYLATASGSIIAYDLAGDDVRWATPLNSTLRFGAAVDDDRVYVHALGSPQSVVTALDATNGDVVWERGFDDGNSGPVLAGDSLFISGTAITALDPATGDVRWESEPLVALGTLAVFDGVVYAGDGDQRGASFLAVDAATGATLWRREDPVHFFYGRPAHDPATNTILAGTQEGILFAYAADTGEVRWQRQFDSALQSSLRVSEGVVYFTSFSGSLYAVDTATGRLLNSFRPGTNLNTLAGPTLGPGVVYAVHGASLHALATSLTGQP